ncbi:MAG: alpha/beta hydrolase, partial [Leptolyngbya sp. ERB_1_2]
MVADFLPSSAAAIRDVEAIALLQQLKRRVVTQSYKDIETAYVHTAAERSAAHTAAIVLLHGFDSSLLEFRRLFPRLATQHETWAIDLLGSGFTESINVTVNSQTIRQHLLSLIQTWIKRPVILVGASLGGAVAIDFALHCPDWVRALVIIDSVGFSGSFPVGKALPRPLIELGADWLHFRKQAALTAALTLPIFDSMLIDAIRCSLLHQEMAGWKEAIVSFTQSGSYGDLSDRIEQVQHPTLILWGKADDVLGIKDATRFKQVISESQLIWVEKAGHVPHLDQPEAIAAQLLRF